MQINALKSCKQTYTHEFPVKSSNGCKCTHHKGNRLDTLVYSRKSSKDPLETLRKRARAKAMNFNVLGALMDLRSDLYNHYKKATTCCNYVSKSNGKLTSRYCNSRACLVCNRIRTGKLFNQYKPLFDKLEKPYFLTLTKPTVKADDLKDGISDTIKEFSRISDVLRKRGIRLHALRKLECTYTKGRFHAHLHVIVDGLEVARMIMDEWLKRNPSSSMKGQNIKKANKKTLSELFKYVAKPPIENDGTLNAWALDRILCAMYRKKTLQPYGALREKRISEDVTPEDATLEANDLKNDLYVWHQDSYDWISIDTGEVLSHYKPTEKDLSFIHKTQLYELHEHT
jgi:hypothetical protein